ncbi:alpha/beta hydrolase [Demequina sp. TTPB684]|uniref:alpha/beta hydrolase n=1 Tax=unclassified Demequina TaxID=2620311 RepID=UPI001CF5A1FB|nr:MULTISPECIES: alpha/beta hydrolase [unclassified Demequina]MCB2412915.1 alpha/beta hydrolase [Demequina sp. TTPB684]UPU87860.1 alpha/beta hydrolase [Demequina sp. TMPB413]
MTDVTARPPFDAAVARALDEYGDAVVTGMTDADIPHVRALAAPFSMAELTMHGAFAREERTVTRPSDGTGLSVVVYTPVDARRPLPVLLHLHGGGLIAGQADSDTPGLLQGVADAGCALVVVDYRLAPEHPFPAALDDATTALAWLASDDAPPLLDGSRIVLSGVSAGGGLAATAALYARDHDGPPLAGLLLMCPMLDHRSDSPSARQMEGTGSWDRTANATGWRAYLGQDPSETAPPPYASAASCDDHRGLPPTFIDVGSAETFRSECVSFADAIWTAGGDAELHVWPGGAHGFDFLAPWARMARDARAARTAWLRRVLSRS